MVLRTVNETGFVPVWDFYRDGSRKKPGFCYAVDEHYYVPCDWMYSRNEFYDDYDRDVAA